MSNESLINRKKLSICELFNAKKRGLKIPWVEIPVPVRFRSAAFLFSSNPQKGFELFYSLSILFINLLNSRSDIVSFSYLSFL